jgi:hypothetical protein
MNAAVAAKASLRNIVSLLSVDADAHPSKVCRPAGANIPAITQTRSAVIA